MPATPISSTVSYHLLLALFLGILCGTRANSSPIITEFLSANSSVLADEDGEYPDWIEIFNPDSESLDLGGYHLTDDPAALTKWSFPTPTSIPAGSFIIVFASDKDRALAGSQLHTNFKLSSAGEYLALVAPNGTDIVSDYSPTFPPQFTDISYGLEQLGGGEETIVDLNAPCRALVPANGNLGSSWTAAGFDASSWPTGSTGIGYERSNGYQDFIELDVESGMYNHTGSVYLRIPFNLTNPAELTALTLHIQYDDGFVAYLNGTRVASSNAPADLAWDSLSSDENYDADARNLEPFSLGGHAGLLLEGENVLAIHGLNRSTDSSDLLIHPRLTATRVTAPTIGGPGYFSTPSPGAHNGLQQGLPASEVTISEPSKTFASTFQVELSGAALDQTIRYTLDGSIPTPSSSASSGPITISSTTQLRARIFGANNASGPVAMATYLRLGNDLRDFNSNLPIVILENWGSGRPGTNQSTDGFWAIIEPDAEGDKRASILDPLQIGTRCGMRRRGSSSANWDKYSLALEAQDENKEDQNIEPLGLPAESDWILSGRYEFDRALMRNPLIYRLSNEAGEYAPRTRFVEVFNHTQGGDLSYAGSYFGVYTLIEKIKRDDRRVDVAPIGPGDITEPDISGGYIFKKDRLDPNDQGFWVNSMETLAWVEPKEEEVVPAQQTWLTDNLNELDAALNAPNWINPTTQKHFTDYLDTSSWIRHHWCNTLAKNVDGFRLSGYYYKNRSNTNDGKVGAGPIWDFDRTMESTDGRDDSPTTWDGTGDSSLTWEDPRFPWWGSALKNPDFRQAHTDLWQELRQSTFSWSNIESVIDEFTAQLDFQDPSGSNPGLAVSPAARNFVRWAERPPRNGSHAGEVTILKNWLRTRTSWIDGQYTSQPKFTILPGLVSSGTKVYFSGTTGTVYFTTDQSDPRLPGGGISPSASTSFPIVVDASTIITARARRGTGLTSWSGPIQRSFLVGPIATSENLALTEIHYAPLPASSPAELAISTNASDFEFLELTNTSSSDTIDLTDVHFEAGIDFTFSGSAITSLAPGERVLIVNNLAAFEARYGTSHSSRITGQFAPSRLDNDGERIHLVNGPGDTIADFIYNDKAPWPPEAGYAGYSLVLNSLTLPNPDYTLPANWRSSGFIDGAPNAPDSTPLVGDPAADEDNDGLSNLVEHALGTSDTDSTQGRSAYSLSVQSIEIDSVPNDYLTLSLRRNLQADDVTIEPYLTFDLIEWIGGEANLPFVSEINQGDGTSLVTYRTTFPFDAAMPLRTFFRLSVTTL